MVKKDNKRVQVTIAKSDFHKIWYIMSVKSDLTSISKCLSYCLNRVYYDDFIDGKPADPEYLNNIVAPAIRAVLDRLSPSERSILLDAVRSTK